MPAVSPLEAPDEAQLSPQESGTGGEKRTPFATTAGKPYPRFRFEWLLVAAVVVIGGLVVAVWSRNAWFYTDVWDFLALRRITEVESIMRPHFGHWQVPAAVQTRLLYAIAEMDFWPVHYLPRTVWWAGFSVFSWWVMRRRGAHPVAALGAVAVITVLATSFYFQAAHIGAPIAIACALGAGLLIEARTKPGNKERLLLFLLMLLAVMSAGVGVSSLLGITLGLLIVRRLGRWLVSVAAAGAIYVTWFIAFDVTNADAARALTDIPWAVTVNVKNVLLGLTGLPGVVGWPLLVAVIVGAVWLAWKRPLTVFDVLILCSAFVYIVLVSRTRSNLERGPVATNVTLLLVPVFVPYIALVKRRTVIAVGLVLAALAVSHGFRLESGLDERIAMINDGRPTIESMATLIRRGEPYLPELRLTDLSGSSQLTLRGMARLVDEGWDPGLPAAESPAAVRLRVSFFGEAGAGDATVEATVGKLRRDGCVISFDGAPIVLHVTGEADLTIRAGRKTELAVEWADGDSRGRAILEKIRRQERALYLFAPPDGATVTLDPVQYVPKMLVCGVHRFALS